MSSKTESSEGLVAEYVTALIGISLRFWSARMVSANSKPFMSGISMSVTTTLKFCPERSAASPSCALVATRTL